MTIDVRPGQDIQAALDQLGDEIRVIRFAPGVYDQARLRGPAAPEGEMFTLDLGEAVLDFGCRDWASLAAGRIGEGGAYRQLRLGKGYELRGGVIQGAGAMAIMTPGRLLCEGTRFDLPCAIGIQVLQEGVGEIEVRNSVVDVVGRDPEFGDPLWSIVGRVPEGEVLRGGGIEYDIHQAVANAGLTERIVYAADPDLTADAAPLHERTLMYFLCKQLGYKGTGFPFAYLERGRYAIEDSTFRDVSGPVAFLRGCERARLTSNDVAGAAALYTAWNGARGITVERNRVRVEWRDNGPREAFGWILNTSEVPAHEGNQWEYHQGERVYAYRAWYDSPVPDLAGDAVFSDDGQAVPIYGGGSLPVQPPEPPAEECPCQEALVVVLEELRAVRAEQERQGAILEVLQADHAQMSAQVGEISEKLERPLVPQN